jgi:hypothetical protein
MKLARFAALLTLVAACKSPAPAPVHATDSGLSAPSADQRDPIFDEHPAPAPPRKPDPRTPLQIAMAACSGPDGTWRCSGIKQPLKAGGAQPLIPPSYTVPAWAIDPANSTGCASDSNSGTSPTCGTSGIGPLLTWQELAVRRWGFQSGICPTPRLQQTTAVTFYSNDGVSDPIRACPQTEGAAVAFSLQGNLGAGQAVCTGTISSVTGRTITNTRSLTQVTLPCTAAVNELVVDSTAGAVFWTYAVNSAAPAYFVTTPMTPYAIGSNPAPADVAIANGDTVTVYSPVSLSLLEFSPFYEQNNSANGSFASVDNLAVTNDSGQRDSMRLNGTGAGIVAYNVLFNRVVICDRASSRSSFGWNSLANDGIITTYVGRSVGASASQYVSSFTWGGGDIVTQSAPTANAMAYTDLELDTIVASSASNPRVFIRDGEIGSVYLDSSTTLSVDGRNLIAASFTPSIPSGTPAARVWGPGTFNVAGKLESGASGATSWANLLGHVGAVQLNSDTVGCVCNSTTGIGSCGTTVSAANLDTNVPTDAGLGRSCLCNPGGLGSYCNGAL